MSHDVSAASLLGLMWLASPALPVGAFSYSEGLESAVEASLVHDEVSAGDWLLDQLWLQQGRAELPTIHHGMQAWAARDDSAVQTLNAWVVHTRESAEQRAQTLQMGTSLWAWLRNGQHASDERLTTHFNDGVTWPVAYALALTLAQASPTDGLLASAFGWAENMVQASMKAVPLGQAAAQRILARLTSDIPAVVDAALAVPAEQRQAFTPMLALLSAQHETQYTRIFRS
jgi:urease accessory protein